MLKREFAPFGLKIKKYTQPLHAFPRFSAACAWPRVPQLETSLETIIISGRGHTTCRERARSRAREREREMIIFSQVDKEVR